MGNSLLGKVAIVTGSGQGIGRGIALGLAREGCKVITNNRKPGGASRYRPEDMPEDIGEQISLEEEKSKEDVDDEEEEEI